jgi:hypothetical protein
MNEPEVVVAIAEYLDDRDCKFFVDSGYSNQEVNKLPDRLDDCGLNGTIRIGRRTPDIIGYDSDSEIFAIEVKGSGDPRKGIGQAAHYRRGVHKSYLAAPEEDLDEFKDTIFSCGIGAYFANREDSGDIQIETEDPVENVGATELTKTQRALAIKTSDYQSDRSAFSSSTMPLNAFLPVIMIERHSTESVLRKDQCVDYITDHEHGLGRTTSAHSFALARTLQLIEVESRNPVRLRVTDVGRMGYYMLKGKVDEFSDWKYGIDQSDIPDEVDERILSYLAELKGNSQYKGKRVYQSDSEVAAFLRDRYLTVPDIRVLTKVLSSYDGNEAELSRILTEIAMDTPDVFVNLFVVSDREREFQELIEESQLDPESESIQESILGLASPDYLYNFVSQLIHVRILNADAEPVHQSEERNRGSHHWAWDESIIGDLGFQTI